MSTHPAADDAARHRTARGAGEYFQAVSLAVPVLAGALDHVRHQGDDRGVERAAGAGRLKASPDLAEGDVVEFGDETGKVVFAALNAGRDSAAFRGGA